MAIPYLCGTPARLFLVAVRKLEVVFQICKIARRKLNQTEIYERLTINIERTGRFGDKKEYNGSRKGHATSFLLFFQCQTHHEQSLTKSNQKKRGHPLLCGTPASLFLAAVPKLEVVFQSCTIARRKLNQTEILYERLTINIERKGRFGDKKEYNGSRKGHATSFLLFFQSQTHHEQSLTKSNKMDRCHPRVWVKNRKW